jgi:DNA-binding response OmpR family regulator
VSFLIVEDDPVLGQLMAEILSLHHVQCRVASDARHTLECLHEFKPQLVIMDMNLPDMKGLDLLAKIRMLPDGASIPVVLMTADTIQAEKAYNQVAKILIKPVSMEEIDKLIAEYNK